MVRTGGYGGFTGLKPLGEDVCSTAGGERATRRSRAGVAPLGLSLPAAGEPGWRDRQAALGTGACAAGARLWQVVPENASTRLSLESQTHLSRLLQLETEQEKKRQKAFADKMPGGYCQLKEKLADPTTACW